MKHPIVFSSLFIATCVVAQSAFVAAAPLRFGTLLQTDFESGSGWPGIKPTHVGTIDIAGSKQPSLGLSSGSMLSSGPLALKNTETNPGKLTLAFMLSASAARPVTVRVESFDKRKKRTGGVERTIFPAAPNFFQRYALELSGFQAVGKGRFALVAPFHSISLSIGAADWRGVATPEIRLDNVQFAKPAFYVSEKGNDNNDGRAEQTAFATPQKAVDMAGPGDIIDVMNGSYAPKSEQGGVALFGRGGTPAAWIVLKNYPGQSPVFPPLTLGTRSESAELKPEPGRASTICRRFVISKCADCTCVATATR